MFSKLLMSSVISSITLAASGCFAQNCAILNGATYAQGDMFAVTAATPKQLVRLNPGPLGYNELDFDPRIRLVYVLDKPTGSSFGFDRNFSGVLAVRLVSTSRNAEKPSRPPTYVYLKRDSVVTRRKIRNPMTGEVATGRYFVYHNPHELRASDSYLERQFHTEYTYKSGDRDRRTYEPDERRAQFAFPEMHAQDPANALDRFISSVFGATAIAAGEQSRFEAQVKYYRESREPRCVTISSVLQPSDNGKLQISLSDLDFPRETQPFDTGSYSWVINWRTPQALR